MEGGHDRPAVLLLHTEGLHIGGHFHRPDAGPEDGQDGEEHRQGRGQEQRRQGDAEAAGPDRDHDPAAEAGDQPPAEEQRGDRADRHDEQREAEDGLAERELLLDVGNVRRPGGDSGPIQEENRQQRPARGPRARCQARLSKCPACHAHPPVEFLGILRPTTCGPPHGVYNGPGPPGRDCPWWKQGASTTFVGVTRCGIYSNFSCPDASTVPGGGYRRPSGVGLGRVRWVGREERAGQRGRRPPFTRTIRRVHANLTR